MNASTRRQAMRRVTMGAPVDRLGVVASKGEPLLALRRRFPTRSVQGVWGNFSPCTEIGELQLL